MDKIQEATNGFIESGKDPAKLFEFAEATLDEVTFFVNVAVILPLYDAITFRGNHRNDGLLNQQLQQGICIIGFIHEGLGSGLASQQGRRWSHSRDLAGGDDEPQGMGKAPTQT